MITTKDVFIWTEIYNCGKIGKIALESFRKHHPGIKVHVYGTQKDFTCLNHDLLLEFHDISLQIQEGFKQGHLGTAMLWANLIQLRSEQYMLHFDSDVIFRQECVSDIINGFNNGHSLVGPMRNYINNPNNRDDVRHLQDITQTYFFGFDRSKIKHYSYDVLVPMCRGTYNPYGHPVIDFFDPVQFDIVYNGGAVYILKQEDFGSCDFEGRRAVGLFAEENRHMDFGHKICHFSAVGSGMNFYNNGSGFVPTSYSNYAKERYALYNKIFYNETINIPIDEEKYKAILAVKDWM
jgi:hypothetical protein